MTSSKRDVDSCKDSGASAPIACRMRAILPEIGTRKHGILQGVPWMTHHQIIPDELFADRSIHGTPTKLRKVKEAYDLNKTFYFLTTKFSNQSPISEIFKYQKFFALNVHSFLINNSNLGLRPKSYLTFFSKLAQKLFMSCSFCTILSLFYHLCLFLKKVA